MPTIFRRIFKIDFLLYFFLIIVISLVTFWRAFDINLRADDYIVIWVATNPLYKYLTFIVDDLFKLHPVLTFHVSLFANLFGYNTFYWQLSGYFLKVVDSLVIVLMMYGVTKSKKASFFSGLIFASFAGGLESFIWEAGRAPAIIIAPLCLGIYFWVISKRDKLISKYYLLSILFFLLTIFLDPGRGVMILALVFIWDLLMWFQTFAKKEAVLSLKKNSLLVLLVITGLFVFKQFTNNVLGVADFTTSGQVAFLATAFEYIPSHPLRAVTNFMYSMGNLLVGWFIMTYESGHFSIKNTPALIASLFFILLMMKLLKELILRKQEKSRIILFFMSWIPVTYFPNWLLTGFYTGQDGLIAGLTHRYLAISSVGLICLLGYITARQKKLKGVLLLIIIVAFNIAIANQVLQKESTSRSSKFANQLWDQIDKEVPKDEKNSVLIFKGGDPVNTELVGSDAIPFGIRRGMTRIEELPIIRVEPETILEMLCRPGVLHFNALRDMVSNEEPIPLSHIHVWTFINGKLTNISENERENLAKEANCQLNL